MKTLKLLFPAALGLCLLSATSGAVEIRHTAHLWFCENERQAHGLCRTSHSSCAWDCQSLNFDCSVQRQSRTLGRHVVVHDDVASEGRYSTVVNVPLYGSGTISYCARNSSKYRNLLGTVVLGQPSQEDCKVYAAYRSTGGEEP